MTHILGLRRSIPTERIGEGFLGASSVVANRFARTMLATGLGVAAWVVAEPAMAGSCWAWSSQPGCAIQIGVAPNDVPAVLGCDDSVYTLQEQTGNCSGELCEPTPTWVADGPFQAQAITVDPFGSLSAVDFSGGLWEDDSGSSFGGLLQPTGAWGAIGSPQYQVPGGCASYYSFSLGGTGNYNMISLCGSGDLWTLQQVPPRTTTEISVAGGAVQTAGFTGPDQHSQTPWMIDGYGFDYAFDGANWQQEPGFDALAITDHYKVAFDGNVYVWNDGAPDELSDQFVPGDWQGPVIGPTPTVRSSSWPTPGPAS